MLNALVLLSFAQTQPPAAPNNTFMFGILLAMLVFMYFASIRPAQQARKKHEEMINSVRRGDSVVTSGGLVGKVTKVPEDSPEIIIELADGVQVTCIKSTLSDVRSKNQPKDKKETSEKK